MINACITLLVMALANQTALESDLSRVLAVAQKIESVFQKMENYSCDIEALYFQEGVKKQRYFLKYYFRRKGEYRIEFVQPYHGMVIYYRGGEEDLTVAPFGLLPGVKFRYPVNNALFRTPAGQRVDQIGIDYFLAFLFRNLRSLPQENPLIEDNNEEVSFRLQASDYIEGKTLEKYRIFVLKQNWLPSRLERYDLKGQPIEITLFRNYRINAPLKDHLFTP